VRAKLDPLFEDAVRLTREAKKGSTSVLQRGLQIGYLQAVRLIDAMEREGVVGPEDGLNPRKVLRRQKC
jgi:S-DNA-T family DNA segregation ATPase FtsK/SpoIIIE